MREVREETGVSSRVVAPLPGVEYWFVERGAHRVHKRVDYFLLAYLSGDTADFDAREVSGAEWFTWEDGLAKLSFENERRVVERAREVATGTPAAAPADGGEARDERDGEIRLRTGGGEVP